MVLAVGVLSACSGGGATTGSPASEACPPAGAARSLTGAGSTFDNPLFMDWFLRYNDMCGVRVNYQSVGSGAGIQQLTDGTIDFGASDAIMNGAQKAAMGPAHHIPVTSDAVAIIYNIKGVDSLALTLDAGALSGIFLGHITRWNDPAITALNSGISLPNEDINVVHRSDGSGTTYIFTDYLAKVSGDWKNGPGTGTSVEWPVGTGAQGSEGVSGQVQQLPGSISYVSLAYAGQTGIPYARIKNSSGNAIEPAPGTATAAQEGVGLPDDMEVMVTNPANPLAYPITGFSWLLVRDQQTDKAKAETIAHLFRWMLTDAQRYAADLGYVPLSDAAADKALAELDEITYDGTPILELR